MSDLSGQGDQQPAGPFSCDHCGEPVPPKLLARAPEGGPYFCCTGCAAVYSALHEAGLEHFYAYQDLGVGGEAGPPPSVALDEVEAQDAFLTSQARVGEDGSCSLDLHVDGLHCAGCVWLIEQLPRHVDGVEEAHLDVGRARLEVRWNPEQAKPSQIVRWLAKFGYGAHPLDASRDGARDAAEAQLLRRMGVAWSVAGNVMLLAFADYAGLDAAKEPLLAGAARWMAFLVSIISMVYGADLFMRRAFASAVSFVRDSAEQRAPLSMDVPLALGILVGWSASAWATVTGSGEVWFDSVAMLTAGLLTARWVQLRASRLARHAAERLLSLLPRTARRITEGGAEDGQVIEIAADELKVGDLVEVRLGETIPADGVIEIGQSHLDRAVLTGETEPERVGVGQRVEAGSVNKGAVLRVRVERAGEATRVGALLGWIEDRARRRAPIVQTADRFGAWFVGGVLGIAALTAVVWSFIDPAMITNRVVAILVISCPCALAMATPLALAVSVGRAARRAIFIKHDDVIEALATASVVVLDKTGTLTEGAMTVVGWEGDAEAIALACALESRSAHPIARAFSEWGGAPADEEDVAQFLRDIEAAEEVAGCGVSGTIAGQRVRVGRLGWVEGAEDASLTQEDAGAQELRDRAASWTERDATPVGISIDGALRAVVGVGDALRADAPALIETLVARGVRPVILSGDDPRVVARLAARLGIEEAYGGQSPEQKLSHVEQLCGASQGAVIMVGDGVNDAAAMQAADVGVAVHGGAQVSLIAADVFLTRPGVLAIVELITGAQRTMQVIRRNLISSAIYNVIAVGFAAVGLVSPLVAALLMPLSSLSVVISSWLSPTFSEHTAATLEQYVHSQTDERAHPSIPAVPRRPIGQTS